MLNRTIAKNIAFEQKTKLIVKIISKHLQLFIYLFLFQQILENGKKEIERNYSALHEKLTDGSREKEKKENSSKVIPQTHNYGPPTVSLHFHVTFIPVIVLVFEQKEPMAHRFHDELKETLRSFLACF